jgi:hypothetical protein
MDWVIRIFLYLELKRVLQAFFIANGAVDIDAFNLLLLQGNSHVFVFGKQLKLHLFFVIFKC